MNKEIFETIQLDDEFEIYNANSIREFNLNLSQFNEIWDEHPEEYHKIKMYGK